MLKFYNTLSREKEEFKPLKKNKVKIYTCGPTIYDHVHIGNLSTYLFSDLVKRYLKYSGYKIDDVMNLTDVDDKTIKASQEKNMKLEEYTQQFEKTFLKDLEKLNIEKPAKMPQATNYVKEMIKLVKKLEKQGYTYQGEDKSVYFRISKFDNYGKFAGIKQEDLKLNADGRTDADEYDKENASDFVLWKAWSESDGDVKWDSPWGEGRPGWHLECSAMIRKELGDTIDIHIGGEDLVFPHHQNEIAQSEAVSGKQFVKFRLHKAFLKVDGRKMAKSLGNFYTLKDLEEKGYDPLVFRYLILTNHYKQPLNFTWESLDAAKEGLRRIQNFVIRLGDANGSTSDDIKAKLAKLKVDVEEKMDDDLNTPQAIAEFFEYINKINVLIDKKQLSKQNADDLLKFLENMDQVWGFLFYKSEDLGSEFGKKVETLIQKRNEFRKETNFEEADKIRNKLLEMKVEINDEGGKTTWRKV